MEITDLAARARPHLHLAADVPLEAIPIEKGGSTRRFFRLSAPDGKSAIAMRYDRGVAENRLYCEVADFLRSMGVPAPEVFLHEPDRGMVLMQDLGETDLWALRDQPWEIRRPLYRSALGAVHRLHRASPEERARKPGAMHGPFDEALYRWEQGYFFEHCLGTAFGVPEPEWRALALSPALLAIARSLASFPRVLVHRDFQSQNILVRDGRAWLIDFQGMREGLAAYDLASLLLDPYIRLTPAERDELLRFYLSLEGADEFRIEETFRPCALQRLMQALGAYGFLGHVKGRTDFLAHIPNAMRALRELLDGMDGMESLRHTLDEVAAAQSS